MFKAKVNVSITPKTNGYLVSWNDPNQPSGTQTVELVALDLVSLKALLHTQVDTLTEIVSIAVRVLPVSLTQKPE